MSDPSSEVRNNITSTVVEDGKNGLESISKLKWNMMREQRDRDPFKYYEVVQVLGTGSMGSVTKVRKRHEYIGGSARKHVVFDNQCHPSYFPCKHFVIFLKSCGEVISGSKHVTESRRSDMSSTSHSNCSTSSNFSSNQRTKNESLRRPPTISSSTYEMCYALKSIHLNRLDDQSYIKELKNEISILKRLDHPNIVRPIETFLHKRRLYIVMELCCGGDLYSRDPYSENDACMIVEQILSAVSYMHRFNVMHRDLKYENILFLNSSSYSKIKIIDFGLSKKYLPEHPHASEHVGTIYTMAPEVLQGKYTNKADLWSIGVIAFMLLSSQLPFYGKKRRHVVDKIMECNFNMDDTVWFHVSDEAKKFVKSLIQLNPDDRPEGLKAINSIWFRNRKKNSERSVSESNGRVRFDERHDNSANDEHAENLKCISNSGLSLREPVPENNEKLQTALKKFSDYGKLKRLAHLVVAYKSTAEELGYLNSAFEQYDLDRSGSINFVEFKEALSSSESSEDDVEKMFQSVDLDGSGLIHYTEFLAATLEAKGVIEEERLAEAFDRLDSDDSGYISIKNLREFFGEETSDKKIKQMIQEVTKSHDDKVSYEEFLALWYGEDEEISKILDSPKTKKKSLWNRLQRQKVDYQKRQSINLSHQYLSHATSASNRI